MPDIRQRFFDDAAALLGLLRSSIDRGASAQDLTIHTHSLKTMALQLGAEELAELIHKLEGRLRGEEGPVSGPASRDQIQEDLALLDQSLRSIQLKPVQEGRTEGPSSEKKAIVSPDLGGQCQKILHGLITSTDLPTRRKIALLLGRGYRGFALVYQGFELEHDHIGLRFQQIHSRLERDFSILCVQEDSGLYALIAMQAPRPGRLEESLVLAPPEATPLCRLILKQDLDLDRMMALWAAADLELAEMPGPHSEDILLDLEDFAYSEARRLSKSVRVQRFGFVHYSGHVADTIRTLCQQAIRNALVHGLEERDQRQVRGKTAEGNLIISALDLGASYLIRVEDDGRGLRPEFQQDAGALGADLQQDAGALGADLQQDAGALGADLQPDGRGLGPEMQQDAGALAPELQQDAGALAPELQQDARIRDPYSGRGIGMDAMKWLCQNLLRGEFAFKTVEGRGASVEIRIPSGLHAERGVCLLAEGMRYFVPMERVRGLVSELQELMPSRIADTWYGSYFFQNLPILQLENQGSGPNARPLSVYTAELAAQPALILREGDRLCTLIVDQLSGSEIVARLPDSKEVFCQSFGSLTGILPPLNEPS